MMPLPANPIPWWIRAYRLASWILVLSAVHIALSAAGRVLPTPPAPWNGGDVFGWLSTTDATVSSFALLRLVALAIAWYLTAVTVLALVARLSGVPELIRLADRAAIPLVRRVIHHAIGVGLAVAIVGTSAPLFAGSSTAWADPVGNPVVTMRVIDDGPPSVPSTVVTTPSAVANKPVAGAPTEGVQEVRMILIEPSPENETPSPPPSPPADASGPDRSPANVPPTVSSTQPPPITAPIPSDPSPASEQSTPPTTQAVAAAQTPDRRAPASSPANAEPLTATTGPADNGEAMWTIAPGDHLWHVAEQTLANRWQRPPSEVETARYWRDLIERNQDRLAHPGHADLVFPGQQFVLPSVPVS